MTLPELAARINTHIQARAAQPDEDGWVRPNVLCPFSAPAAKSAGAGVTVRYKRGIHHKLTRGHAVAYLAWLDAGNIGTHHDALRGTV